VGIYLLLIFKMAANMLFNRCFNIKSLKFKNLFNHNILYYYISKLIIIGNKLLLQILKTILEINLVGTYK